MFWLKVYKDGWSYKIVIDDDSKVQEVMDLCHKHFGEPGKVLDIPRKLPEPKAKRGRRS